MIVVDDVEGGSTPRAKEAVEETDGEQEFLSAHLANVKKLLQLNADRTLNAISAQATQLRDEMRSRTARDLSKARTETKILREQITRLERQLSPTAPQSMISRIPTPTGEAHSMACQMPGSSESDLTLTEVIVDPFDHEKNGPAEQKSNGIHQEGKESKSLSSLEGELKKQSNLKTSTGSSLTVIRGSKGKLKRGKSTLGKRGTQNEDEKNKVKAVFADASAMKEQVRLAVAKKPYNVADYYFEEGCAQNIARNQYFENVTLCVIGLNAFWIMIDTDYNTSISLLDADPIFQVAENAFCLYFSVEWIIRFLAFKRKRDGLRDAWFCFDTMLVVTMVFETWLLNIFFLAMGGGNLGASLGDTSVLKLVRLVRLTRMARMARLLRAVPELIILIKGMLVASRSVVLTLVLLVIIMYFFAIVFCQVIPILTDDESLREAYFPNVPGSMMSLLLDGVLPDMAPLVRDSSAQHWLLGTLCLMFILLASLTVMNMLVGVLCEVVSVVSSVEKEHLAVSYVKMKLLAMFEETGFDEDGNSSISKEEFQQLLVKPEAAQIIQEIGVDVVGLVDMCDDIFTEHSNELSFGDFMELVMQLRGTNTATVKDIVDMRRFLIKEMSSKQDKLNDDLSQTLADAVATKLEANFATFTHTKAETITHTSVEKISHLSHSKPKLPDFSASMFMKEQGVKEPVLLGTGDVNTEQKHQPQVVTNGIGTSKPLRTVANPDGIGAVAWMDNESNQRTSPVSRGISPQRATSAQSAKVLSFNNWGEDELFVTGDPKSKLASPSSGMVSAQHGPGNGLLQNDHWKQARINPSHKGGWSHTSAEPHGIGAY